MRCSLLCIMCLWLSACTGLFFHPTQQPGVFPNDAGLAFEEVLLEGEQGELYAWWIPAVVDADRLETKPVKAAKGTVVFAHGNAGNLSSHLGFVYWLPKAGYNVFMFDYRGYGRSQGKPSAMGIVDDTQRAISYVQQRLVTESLAEQGIVVYGHSLGGATSLSALAVRKERQHIKGLIVDSAFASYRGIAKDKLKTSWMTAWLSPFVSLLVTGEPVPEALAADIYPLPIYVSHSPGDQVIPFDHGQRVYERALDPKNFYTLKSPSHNHGWQWAEDRRWLLESLETLFSATPPIDPPQ